MSDTERTHERSLIYSAWHRTHSTKRWVSEIDARALEMTDVDSLWLEYAQNHRWPRLVAVIETAFDSGEFKPASVLITLARTANVPGFVVLYTPAPTPNPADSTQRDIAGFRVEWVRRDLADPPQPLRHFTPAAWARFLVALRQRDADGLRRAWYATPECLAGRNACQHCARFRAAERNDDVIDLT
jgi:hypothetical protein